ncbi:MULTISPECIES: K+/H+ antiporter subunit F [Malaciobacter]|jgi:multicomponent K+:H+ antiporter subunit F|uniref:Multisubunit potassium/proton antiporter PhaF subunit n=2 Tax=Malaciobacter TaxID=2321114 RepID=A0AB36ZRV9_9BACT|nr:MULTISPECIES: K+/H+ antiporter subunit F [Malaciobacter]PHO11173.1 K+/H+ antiporter subunit F [Malaciobacter canalis]PPK58288.1 multisubunit potassium/proton antiporter PhaF subunit [Malaciobacter marinus]QEE33258.1 multisubunit sodium:proton antiporter, MnhF subunit [Malaciobacter canalis]SKB32236.1 multisubunit potassium/proton antiporter, PhaF subunit [Malaciobacter marinus]
MLEFVLPIAFIMITIAMIFNIYRLIVGPSVADRILSLDTLYINSIALLIIYSLHLGNTLYFEAALLIAVMGFVGTVALSKYLLRGDIME